MEVSRKPNENPGDSPSGLTTKTWTQNQAGIPKRRARSSGQGDFKADMKHDRSPALAPFRGGRMSRAITIGGSSPTAGFRLSS